MKALHYHGSEEVLTCNPFSVGTICVRVITSCQSNKTDVATKVNRGLKESRQYSVPTLAVPSGIEPERRCRLYKLGDTGRYVTQGVDRRSYEADRVDLVQIPSHL